METHAENFAEEEALLKEDIKNTSELLNDLLFTSISYFDYNGKFYMAF